MIEESYIKQRPKSKALYREALGTFPSGVTHDTRFLIPFPTYISEAKGSRKWDVDGNEYVDFAMGHGALLLGHGREEVVGAVRDILSRGTHYGASSEIEIKWGNMVKELVPSAEVVRFTSSGTEATLLALRLARAYTGKSKIVKFHGHFHGWQDYLAVGERPPWEVNPVGVPDEVVKTIIAIPSNLSVLEETLKNDKDVAGVILEPTGGSWAKVPTHDGFLEKLRVFTKRHGVLLIFDEVVTGFRWSKGGAQELYGVTPDITTLAKILAGGFPGGAVAGRREIMEMLEFTGDEERDRRRKIKHQGTFNANPVSAAAGIACLEIASTGEPQKEAASRAGEIRRALNEIIRLCSVDGCVYGDSSVFHVILGVTPENFTGGDIRNPSLPPDVLKIGGEKNLTRSFPIVYAG
jgi:Glutamate-1-semialdehyde aminotransferase